MGSQFRVSCRSESEQAIDSGDKNRAGKCVSQDGWRRGQRCRQKSLNKTDRYEELGKNTADDERYVDRRRMATAVQAASPAIICWSRNARPSPLWDSCDPWMHFFLAARTRSCWHGSPTCSRGSRRTHLKAASSSLKTEIPPIAPVLLFAFSYQFYCEPHFSSVHVHPPQ